MIFHLHVMLLSFLVQQKKIILITLQNYYSMILEMNMILAVSHGHRRWFC